MQNEIELVIRIPEVDYVHFKELYESLPKDPIFVDTVVYYIGNGTPLPKGHGELVDIRPLMRGLYEEKCVGELTYTTSEVYRMIDNETSIIVKADKEREEIHIDNPRGFTLQADSLGMYKEDEE